MASRLPFESRSEFYGLRIETVVVKGAEICIDFGQGLTLDLVNIYRGSPDEEVYFTCDDELTKIVDGVLRRIDVKLCLQTDIKHPTLGQAVDELMFLEIGTDECFISVCAHCTHNGCYGPIEIGLKVITATDRAEAERLYSKIISSSARR